MLIKISPIAKNGYMSAQRIFLHEQPCIINTDYIVRIEKQYAKVLKKEGTYYSITMGTTHMVPDLMKLFELVIAVDEPTMQMIYRVCNVSVENQLPTEYGINAAPNELPDF